MKFIPSPALAHATRMALRVFFRHKPSIFRLALDDSEAGVEFVAEYAMALQSVALDIIPHAAQLWVSSTTDIPSIPLFAKFAKEQDSKRQRSAIEAVSAPHAPAEEPDTPEKAEERRLAREQAMAEYRKNFAPKKADDTVAAGAAT